MMESLSTVRGFSRNPLQIVALFIALIYGFAALLLGSSADKLETAERLPLVWFVVLFPILVLATFYRLVTLHHWKLYGPTDFRSDTPAAVSELADPYLGEPSRRDRINLAKDLGLRKLEKELGLPFKRRGSLGNDSAQSFDGVAQEPNCLVAADVKLVRGARVPASRVREVLYRGFSAVNALRAQESAANFRLILVFVYEGEAPDGWRLPQTTEVTLQDAPFPTQARLYRLADLEKEFGSNSV